MKVVKVTSRNVVAAIDRAIAVLSSGGSVVYPTETAYGLGVDATNEDAVRRMYEIKGRGLKQPTHINVSSVAMAERFVQLSHDHQRLTKKFWPGSLTVVARLTPNARMRTSLRSIAKNDLLGVRVPKQKIALALIEHFGQPITASSANRNGGKTPYAVGVVIKEFEQGDARPDLILDCGKLAGRKPSTLITLENKKLHILREGPITKAMLERILRP